MQEIALPAGMVTHMDAPAHCVKEGLTIADLDLVGHHLITHCVVIDVSPQSHARYLITEQDILDFEKRYGTISPPTFVIFYTGWEKFWHDANQYRHDLLFPSLDASAAQLILERNCAGIGIDTLSPDRPDSCYIVHQLLLQNKKYIVENVFNANKLPATGAFSMALPIKVADLTEAPISLIGLY